MYYIWWVIEWCRKIRVGGEPVGIMMIYYCYATMLLYTEDGFFPPSVCLLLESVYK